MTRAVRYPRRFELFRLEAIGADPFLADDEAAQKYAEGRRLAVTDDHDPPEWYLDILQRRHRYTVTFYSPQRTPIRAVAWEMSGDRLLRRRAIDLFYPEGDPGRRVPYSQLLTVEQRWYADGLVRILRSSPIDDDLVAEVSAPDDVRRLDVPAFGDWAPLVEASAPSTLRRFDLDAIDAADDLAQRSIRAGRPLTGTSRWTVPASDSTVLGAVQALTRLEPVTSRVATIPRGAATIVPIVLQGGPPRGSGFDPAEERRRVDDRAAGLSGAFEYAAGRPIPFALDAGGDDTVAQYAASLRAAGARSAEWWVLEERGVVIVRSGDEDTGDLALSVHVVPAGWVSGRRNAPSGRAPADLAWSRSEVSG